VIRLHAASLTSFPKELFEAYKQAFEQKMPGVKVIVKQQQTNQAVTYLPETRARPEADVFRVSAVDAFQTLKADGLLERVTLPRETLARMPPAPRAWTDLAGPRYFGHLVISARHAGAPPTSPSR